jgi:class 3 adenylate cyclase
MATELAVSEKEIERRARIEHGLSRFLPEEVARSIASGHQSLALGGQRREVSVLFADVVAFTRFAESAQPEQVVALLNELFSVLAEVIFRHGGIVDKFIGDSVMAVFGAPSAQPDHVKRALATAESIHRFVEANAPAWRISYGIEVQMAIGINSGEALVGNLGSEKRMEYTAIGDVVNIAARLEGVAQPGQTLVTAEVTAAAGEEFSFHCLGEHPLRGKRKSVQIFEVV